MSRLVISYKTLEEREKILRALLKGVKIKYISPRPYGNGKYKKIRIDIE